MSKQPLRLAFAGTPQFAATVLSRILGSAEHTVTAVYTRPDRPAGRGRKLTPGPVKCLAMQHGLTLHQPQRSRDLDPCGNLTGVDALLVVAFGMILPPEILWRPRLGCINVHASLLPRWRGAAPIQRAIEAGDSVSGISIMRMDAGVDTGPVLLQKCCPIRGDDTGGSLHDRLADLGGECLLQALQQLAAGRSYARQQEDSLATLAPRINKQATRIDWSAPAVKIERLVRAFNPAPAAHAVLAGADYRILAACARESPPPRRTPGTILATGPAGIDVATGRGVIRIVTLQAPGKKPVSARDFLNAHRGWPSGF